ncbi:hypothetical protein ACWDRB_60795 [Nonomuraea sp. NPDC003707]
MSRGTGKIQRAVYELLASARTVEPWPLYMSAIGLARRIHRTETPSAAQLETVRRACRTSALLERATTWATVPAASPWDADYRVNRPLLIARLTATEAEDWLWRAYLTSRSRKSSWHVILPHADQPGYQRPEPDELVTAVELGALRQEPPADVLLAVNAYSGSDLGPADVARWAQQRARDEEEERACRETVRHPPSERSERLRLGPYFVDSNTVPEECPCCRQTLDPVTWDAARFRDA